MTTTADPAGYGTAVHRSSDGELVGFVDDAGGRVTLRAVFGGVLGTAPGRDAGVRWLEAHGLACLAETWWWHGEQAHIVEAAPGRLRLAVGPPYGDQRTVVLTDFTGLHRHRPS